LGLSTLRTSSSITGVCGDGWEPSPALFLACLGMFLFLQGHLISSQLFVFWGFLFLFFQAVEAWNIWNEEARFLSSGCPEKFLLFRS
jgi:hypothetical protein